MYLCIACVMGVLYREAAIIFIITGMSCTNMYNFCGSMSLICLTSNLGTVIIIKIYELLD